MGMHPLLTASHVNHNAQFDELYLSERPGRKRVIYSFAKCAKVHRFFNDCRNKQDRHIFQIPFHLKEAEVDLKVWSLMANDEEQDFDEMIFDLRTKDQKEAFE